MSRKIEYLHTQVHQIAQTKVDSSTNNKKHTTSYFDNKLRHDDHPRLLLVGELCHIQVIISMPENIYR
jgi:hypothetical protein